MIKIRRILLAATLLGGIASGPARAVQPDEILPEPKLEERARTISLGLRCLVCQNQSIDDSTAELARDLRLLVRERLRRGDSDDQVRAFVVERYGNYALLKPPFAVETLLLWATPALVLAAGAAALLVSLRSPLSRPPTPLSAAERDRLAVALADDMTQLRPPRQG